MFEHDLQLSVHRIVVAPVKTAVKISDLDLQAFVDNQASLGLDDYARIRQAISEDNHLRHRYEELQLQKQMLQLWWEENKRETLQ